VQHRYRGEVEGILSAAAREPGCIKIGNYRSSLAGFALLFGDGHSGNVHSPILERLYPDAVKFDIFDNHFYHFSREIPHAEVRGWIEQGKCVLMEGTPLDSSQMAGLPGFDLEPVLVGAREGLYRVRLTPEAAGTR
jgi:hypothetical protein